MEEPVRGGAGAATEPAWDDPPPPPLLRGTHARTHTPTRRVSLQVGVSDFYAKYYTLQTLTALLHASPFRLQVGKGPAMQPPHLAAGLVS